MRVTNEKEDEHDVLVDKHDRVKYRMAVYGMEVMMKKLNEKKLQGRGDQGDDARLWATR